MGLFSGLWLVVLGVLGAATFIVSRRPDAKDAIAKLAPYQGWIGAISALGGIFNLFHAVINIGWIRFVPFWWITYTANACLLLGLGILLGVGIFRSFVKDVTANARMDHTVAKLAPYQTNMGLAAIGLGVWTVIASVLWRF